VLCKKPTPPSSAKTGRMPRNSTLCCSVLLHRRGIKAPFLLERQHLLAATDSTFGLAALTGYSRFLLTRQHLPGCSRFLLERQHLSGYSRSQTRILENARTPSYTVFS
jgi:hypothetical protein